MITAGKWEYTKAMSEIVAIDDTTGDSLQIAIIQHNDADGYLMAASKDLLHSAKEILAMLRPTESYFPTEQAKAWALDRLKDAIAKAEGK